MGENKADQQQNLDQPDTHSDAAHADSGDSRELITTQGEVYKLPATVKPVLGPRAYESPEQSRFDAASADDAETIDEPEIRIDQPKQSDPSAKPSRLSALFTPLAAGFAIAACTGALAGGLATSAIGSFSAPQVAAHDDGKALRASVAKLGTDVAALKSAIEGSSKTSGSQISKLGERIDRVEKAQAEPAARLTKLSEAIERLERRGDTTGSIPTPAAAQPAKPAAAPPIVEGWVLRDVMNGAALVQGRMGVLEVMPGDALPGLGRVEAVRRQDGRWVVVTAKGLIVAR